MKSNLIAEYLHLLRKEHGYTQKELAEELNISRQAVSGWETGNTIPDLDTLLKLSRLYHVTINDILEPEIQAKEISDFEEIINIEEKSLKESLCKFDLVDIVKASMGASPKVNECLQGIYADVDFPKEQIQIGRVRADEIEDLQKQITAMINLDAILKK